ncbi:MAG: transferase [Thiobacillus sp. 63-78]|uniref:glycosyltransferase family 10 domain-containing protein n=1 Tax=Thiobacillus sp. 63-78 TaxID=1895859 RepID=UPI0009674BAB|nr:glycosyltransferase family 10 [Thiobacillus sp. 63-78]OJZ06612.1 MAG: transferase [Thiobacillus sp. 63-78]
MTDHDELLVRINMDCAPGGMEWLTPGGSLRWGRCRFDFNPESGGRADFSAVLGNARPYDRFMAAPQNTLFIAGEPLSKKLYPQAFYRQFGHVVDSHAQSRHPHLHVSALGLNWHVGLDRSSHRYRYGYDHLAALACPEKQNRIAVVCSNASKTEGQRRRLALLEGLKQRLGDRLVHFGRGFEPIDDKMEAILPYRFQLVLENGVEPHYWTEKLADAYLGWAYPVYLGCPNVADYLPAEALLSINDLGVDTAAARIAELLDQPLGPRREAALAEARHRILNVYNPFAWAAHWAEALYRPGLTEKTVTLRSHKAFRSFPRGHLFRLRKTLA